MIVSIIINQEALFCDETEQFRTPVEPKIGETVSLYFRTGKNDVDEIYIKTGKTEIKMNKIKTTQYFDYYKGCIRGKEDACYYYFELIKDNKTYYYNKYGCVTNEKEGVPFCFVPGFQTPDWAKGAVMYQIFVDRFCNGNTNNDTLSHEYSYLNKHSVKVEDWHKVPDLLDVGCFYGGDLQGVEKKLDYLKWLGVDAIYFNPIFVSPSNHKYDIQDYDYIDPHFTVIENDEGELLEDNCYDNIKATKYISRVTKKENLEASNEYFAKLVQTIHDKGMKVILDGVFNHCGSYNKWMDKERIYEKEDGYKKGAYISEDSPYRDFFRFNSSNWPYNSDYEGWWGYSTLPKINYEQSKEVERYILDIGKKWISSPFSIDGWRLDVAADLGRSKRYNHRFWRKFRQAIKEENKDVIILAEHYGDPSPWLQGDQWDTVMNYDAFMEPVTWFLTGLEKHSDNRRDDIYGNGHWFFNQMTYHMSRMHYPSLFVAMNELSNHDHSRFLTRTNGQVGRLESRGAYSAGEGIRKDVMRLAVMIQMTWPGAPTIYYGDEVGQVGWTDPDSRRTYPWGKEDFELLEFHRYMIKIHKRYSCLLKGSYKPLLAAEHFICYGRFDRHSKAVVVINNSWSGRSVDVPVWEIDMEDGEAIRVIETTVSNYNVGHLAYDVKDGKIHLDLKAHSGMVLVQTNKD